MRLVISPRKQFIFSVGVLFLAATVRLYLIAHLPTGLFTDESFHLLRAEEIARGQAWPVFITGNNGYEPLFVYLTAGLLPILGPVNWVGRLAAAWLGLISVAATLRAGKELFPGRFVGVLAGLSLATLLWSLTFSRFGSQPIIAATASAAALAAFWHGVRTRSWRAYLLAGVCVGLGLDGYIAFRLFPGVLLIAGVALLFERREAWHQWLGGGALTLCAAAIVFAPLAWFFIQNPNWFLHRFNQTTSEVLGGRAQVAALITNGLKVIGGLFVAGDQNWRHNLAGRPALDPAQTLFFGAGLVVLVRRWRRAETWALFAWLVIGLALSVVTIDAPHFGRTTLAMPAVVLVVALGIEAVWRWGRGRVARGLVAAAVVASGFLSLSDFFGRWAAAPELAQAYTGEQVRLAQAIEKGIPKGANLYLYATSVTSPVWSLEYMLGAQQISPHIILGSTNCRFFPSRPGDDAYVVFEDPTAAAELGDIYPTVPVAGASNLVVEYLPRESAARWPVDFLRRVRLGDGVDMAGYTLVPPSPRPGQPLQLRVMWRVNQSMPIDYKLFLHLLGSPKPDGSPIYAQLDVPPCGSAYPTSQWQPGDTLVAAYSLAVPADLPPGNYTLDLGWYDEATAARRPISDDAHPSPGNALTLVQFRVGSN
jgi:hypothetical protein